MVPDWLRGPVNSIEAAAVCVHVELENKTRFDRFLIERILLFDLTLG